MKCLKVTMVLLQVKLFPGSRIILWSIVFKKQNKQKVKVKKKLVNSGDYGFTVIISIGTIPGINYVSNLGGGGVRKMGNFCLLLLIFLLTMGEGGSKKYKNLLT